MHPVIVKSIGLGLNLFSLVAPKQAAVTSANLFSTPPKPRLREKERAFLDTARQVRRTAAGHPIVEFHWGEESRPLVLLSYGWGYNSGRWRHFVPELVAAGFRVLAYDPPGHGLAPAEKLNVVKNAAIIRALLDDHGPAEALLAHSFGGSSSIYALYHMPEKLHPKRMVLMASFSYAPTIFQQYKQALGLWPGLYWRMVRMFEHRVGHSLEAFDFAMMTARLPHVESLIVHSPNDPVTPYTEARRYFDFWPGSHLFSPAEGGHHLGTAGITAAVLRFVSEGKLPAVTERQERPVAARHELVRFFAGV
jgi:pimeloyl-ACP methyl ester carboxylesterase